MPARKGALFVVIVGCGRMGSYLAGSLRSSLLNITVSILGYKWFVFKIRGNYRREWVRRVLVYIGVIALGLVLLLAWFLHRKQVFLRV